MSDQRQGSRQSVLSLAIWLVAAMIAAVVVIRRLSGVITQPWSETGVSLLVLTALGLTLIAYGLAPTLKRTWGGRLLAALATILSPILLGIALMPSGSAFCVGLLAGLFLFVAVTLALCDRAFINGRVIEPIRVAGAGPNESPDSGRTEASQSLQARLPSVLDPSDAEADEIASVPQSPWDDSTEYAHWMARTTLPDGRECISGAARLEFAESQREAVLHLAFCPPLATVPEIECEALTDGTVRLKVAAVYPYGARIEVKRTGSDLSRQGIRIGYTATAHPSDRQAA